MLSKDMAMNNCIFDNNVYCNLFSGKTVMLIVPHEDDEINIGGGFFLICQRVRKR